MTFVIFSLLRLTIRFGTEIRGQSTLKMISQNKQRENRSATALYSTTKRNICFESNQVERKRHALSPYTVATRDRGQRDCAQVHQFWDQSIFCVLIECERRRTLVFAIKQRVVKGPDPAMYLCRNEVITQIHQNYVDSTLVDSQRTNLRHLRHNSRRRRTNFQIYAQC